MRILPVMVWLWVPGLWLQAGQSPPAAGSGQERAALENTGKPMRVEFACTDDDMLAAGMSCSEDDPCPVYLELAAAETSGIRLFAAGNIHSSQSTMYSVLLASDDNGKTWREPYPRQRYASLDRIQFADPETGWTSGQVVQPLPRDPFFLVTGDGGKTWRMRPVFGETRAGAIQQFWFDSKTRGTMLIADGPRNELYESPNGGEVWMVREVSEKPIAVKRRPAPASVLRVRPDAQSKSFRIEKNTGDKWAPVASFLINIGACKPSVQELKPPPENPPTDAVEELRLPGPPPKRKPRNP
jgi:hypothetical protein